MADVREVQRASYRLQRRYVREEDLGKRPVWMPDSTSSSCYTCKSSFSTFNRRHHCRLCGSIFCGKCCSQYAFIPEFGYNQAVRVCTSCGAGLAKARREKSSSIERPQHRARHSWETDLVEHNSGTGSLDRLNSCYILQLSDSLLVRILSFLSHKELAHSVPTVCRRFLRLSDNTELWRQHYCCIWQVAGSPLDNQNLNWKQLFKEKLVLSQSKSVANNSVHFGSAAAPASVYTAYSTASSSTAPVTTPLSQLVDITKENIKVVALGSSRAGKSSLLNYFLNEKFEQDQQPTMGASFTMKNIHVAEQYMKTYLWDTAGAEMFNMLAPMYYQNAHVILLVYDITSMESFDKARYWHKEIKEKDRNKLFVLVGTKADSFSVRVVETAFAKSFADNNGIRIFLETSAKTGYNIPKLFTDIAVELLRRFSK